MEGSVLSSNRLFAVVAAAALGVLGCTDDLPPIEGVASLRLDLIAPADPGSPEQRLDDAARSVEIDVTALDHRGEIDSGFNRTVQLHVHFLGSLTPDLGQTPLATVELTAGVAPRVSLDLPPVFGPTFLWLEDGAGDDATLATGTTEVLWYRDPFIVDVSRPPDEEALDARERSPLEEKQVVVRGSRYGASGRLVVTGTFAQGYTVSDVQCADAAGTPPCVAGAYDSLLVFTFSRAADEEGRPIGEGQVIDGFGGAIQEFNGLTEVGFPQTFATDTESYPEIIPEPVLIEPSWLTSEPIEMEKVEAGLVAVENATLCPLGEEFETFNQWALDLGNGCQTGDSVAAITQGVVPEFDPAEYVGQVLPRVVGTLRPINIGNFNVWIIFPRSMGDLTLP